MVTSFHTAVTLGDRIIGSIVYFFANLLDFFADSLLYYNSEVTHMTYISSAQAADN